jgi:thymidine kinase
LYIKIKHAKYKKRLFYGSQMTIVEDSSFFAGPNIELTFGPMFSGKTSELIKKAEIAKLQYPEYKVLYIMNALDTQRDIFSHSKIFENYKNHIQVCYVSDLTDLLCVTQQEEKCSFSSFATLLNEKTFYSCVCICLLYTSPSPRDH